MGLFGDDGSRQSNAEARRASIRNHSAVAPREANGVLQQGRRWHLRMPVESRRREVLDRLEPHWKQGFLCAVLMARQHGDTVAWAGSAHEWIANSDRSDAGALERIITLIANLEQGIRLSR